MHMMQISDKNNVDFGSSLKILSFDVYPSTNSENRTNGAIQNISTKTMVDEVARGLNNLGKKLSPTIL